MIQSMLVPITNEQIELYSQCMNSFERFCDVVSFKPTETQKSIALEMRTSSLKLFRTIRGEGTTTLLLHYIAWLLTFKANRTYGLVHKDWPGIRDKLVGILKTLPPFMKEHISVYNKTQIELYNGSRLFVISPNREHFGCGMAYTTFFSEGQLDKKFLLCLSPSIRITSSLFCFVNADEELNEHMKLTFHE
jgi:hypothetical protein